MLFVSHANPEDNLFTRWLSLRLAREGYPVWCDLAKLLGGEDFWRDIEVAIRERTAKFLFVLSKNSNHKQGTMMELAVARKVGRNINDFVVPLRIDDIQHDDINIELQRLNCIDFSKSWVAGYAQLIETLEKAGVKRDARFTPDAVTKWWQTNYPANAGVKNATERCLSNWFEFSKIPQHLRLHSIDEFKADDKLELKLPFAVCRCDRYLITFATADELKPHLDEQGLHIGNSVELELAKFSDKGLEHPHIERREARNFISVLFRESFERFAVSKGLLAYELSGGTCFYWFPQNVAVNDKVSFVNTSGEKGWRSVVGYKSVKSTIGETRIRNWHFGVRVKTYAWPFSGFAVKPHVAFTENGTLYDSKARQHSARRSQCKSWYNDDWLDRILATMTFLADPSSKELLIPLSANETLAVRSLPIAFESPVSFEVLDKEAQAEVITPDEELEDEEDEDSDAEDAL